VADIIHQASLPDSRFVRSRKRKGRNNITTSSETSVATESVTFASIKSETESVYLSGNDINATIDTPEFDREIEILNSIGRLMTDSDYVMINTSIDASQIINSSETSYSDLLHVNSSDSDGQHNVSKLRSRGSSGAWNASGRPISTLTSVDDSDIGLLSLLNITASRKKGRLKVSPTINSTKRVTYCPAVPPDLRKYNHFSFLAISGRMLAHFIVSRRSIMAV
jgi:hypothetical protein